MASISAANPALTQGLSIGSNGQALVNGQAPLTQNQQTANLATSALPAAFKSTSTGGVAFNPSTVAGINNPAQTPTATNVSSTPSLSSFINNNYQTPNGGSISTTGGAGGTVTGYTPAQGYSIDTSGSIPSSALSSTLTYNDLQNNHSQYQDFVNGLAQAQGYSPDYLNALQGQYGAQTQGAQLGLNSAALNSNYYTGNNLPGDTLSYAQGATAKAQAQNSLDQAQNSIQQLAANQALNTQQLARTGNIAAAQTQLQYNPASVSSQNAISQYNSLQQQYPNASIPEYNNSISPALNQQIAQELVANSPAYRAQFQSTFQQPGGGTGIYNKLDTSGLQQNSDGTLSLVSSAAAALGSGQAASIQSNIDTYNKLAPAFTAANNDFGAMTQFMQSAGINNASVPIVNQIQNAIDSKALAPGALAAFNAYIASLRTNYASLLGARGETPSQAGQDSQTLIPANLSIGDMQKVQAALNTNGQNILNATQQQIQQGLSSLQGNATFGGNPSVNGGSTPTASWTSLGDHS